MDHASPARLIKTHPSDELLSFAAPSANKYIQRKVSPSTTPAITIQAPPSILASPFTTTGELR
jgi:hypothetical protein